MIALISIAAILVTVGFIAWDAYLFSTHLPELIQDPTNFGSWFWVLLAVVILGNLAMGARNTTGAGNGKA